VSRATIRTELVGDCRHLILQAPERRNPLDHHVLDALEAALFDGTCAAVVLSADAGPAFSAGGDLKLPEPELQRLSDRIYALCRRLSESPAVLIVAADGLAVGGGAQLLLAADLRVAGPALRFRPAVPASGMVTGMWLLPAVVGRGRALDLLLTGRELTGEEAYQWGVVDRLADDPTAAALALAAELAAIPAAHRARVKRGVAAVTDWSGLSFEQATFIPPNRRQERER
jgi:enoyl-CoA hydratase/carnithine racemase